MADAGGAPLDLRAGGSVAGVLLGVGVDASLELHLTEPWNIAVRAAALAELRLHGRILETADQLQIDQSPTGAPWLDHAVALMLGSGQSDQQWIRRGSLRAAGTGGRARSGERCTPSTPRGCATSTPRPAWPRCSTAPPARAPPRPPSRSWPTASACCGPGLSADGRRPLPGGIPALTEMLEGRYADRCGTAASTMDDALRAMLYSNEAAEGGKFAFVPPP
jgi:hypothetical protein